MKPGILHFTLIDESRNHRKFWEIRICDPVVAQPNYTCHYGRIGSKGQTTMKTFGSTQDAIEAAAKVIESKKTKGYELQWQKPHEKRQAISVALKKKEVLKGRSIIEI